MRDHQYPQLHGFSRFVHLSGWMAAVQTNQPVLFFDFGLFLFGAGSSGGATIDFPAFGANIAFSHGFPPDSSLEFGIYRGQPTP